MTIDKKMKERKLVINKKYLVELSKIASESYDKIYEKLDEDLTKVFNGGIVELKAPPARLRLGSLYKEVRSYVATRSIEGNYNFKAEPYDLEKIISVVGHKNIIGNPITGYRFQRAG